MTCCPVNYFLPAADLLRGSLHVGTNKTQTLLSFMPSASLWEPSVAFPFPPSRGTWAVGISAPSSLAEAPSSLSPVKSTALVLAIFKLLLMLGWTDDIASRMAMVIHLLLYITILVAFLGLRPSPSTPDNCNSRFLSADEIRLVQQRWPLRTAKLVSPSLSPEFWRFDPEGLENLGAGCICILLLPG